MLTSEGPMFAEYLDKWDLTPDGEPIVTHSSRLLPVLWQGEAAMLKIPTAVEEKTGCRLMAWWNGEGAARVLAHDDDALLMERAQGSRSLVEMSTRGEDDEATRILCEAAWRLHAHPVATGEWVPLTEWFRSLWPAAETYGGIYKEAARVARELLAEPREVRVLHGDIHHGNILDFGDRGWLAIDPKGLVGERGYDFANIFCNPERDVSVERFSRRVDLVAEAAQIERIRLLGWILAYTGLSMAWMLEDGDEPGRTLEIAELAQEELSR